MAKCKQCGKEYEAKRSTSVYCSPKCKQAFYRNRIPKDVTIEPSKSVTVTTLKVTTKPMAVKGRCWCCGKTIAPILVCCQECAWSGRAKAKRAGAYPPLLTDRTPKEMETDLHSLKFTNYKMTDYEREHYKPTEQLLPATKTTRAEVNPVSKPGDEHYT